MKKEKRVMGNMLQGSSVTDTVRKEKDQPEGGMECGEGLVMQLESCETEVVKPS